MFAFGSKDRFSCALQPDTQNGGEVWMVMYRNDQGTKPWPKMINSFGDGWNTQKRCDTIAQRLESFRQDGLIGFSHRSDPKTPGS
ncbi:COP23 domain-containing protein [Brasilonema octagenarum]|uniref:COP23 domain-containing protein n=1 Tax=Brasilonema octagenarum TaxID=417105 RepID=UPI00210FF639